MPPRNQPGTAADPDVEGPDGNGEGGEKKAVGRPAHELLDAMDYALKAALTKLGSTDPLAVYLRDDFMPVLKMARRASGVRQAPNWRMCADTLREEADEL
jgi:hypothetical protein